MRMAPPADSRSALAAELAPLFDAIDQARSERASPEQARQRATETVRRARAEADELLRQTGEGLADLRAEAARHRREKVGEEIDRIDHEAESEVARIREQAESRQPGLVDQVVACVRGGAQT